MYDQEAIELLRKVVFVCLFAYGAIGYWFGVIVPMVGR